MSLDLEPSQTTPPARPRVGVVAVFLVLAAGLFVAHAWPVLGAPFGDSHDGRNGAMWAGGGRSLREQGPFGSRLGTVAPERGAYGNHPPLIGVETAVAEVVGASKPAASRAPAWIGSLLTLVLLARILTERGLRPAAVGAAVLLVATTPMFLTYGSMLDTPVTALPFALALLLLWLRVIDGTRVHPALLGGAAAAAVLASWQALLVAALVAGWGVIGLLGGRREPVRVAAVAGFATALVLLVTWLAWAYDWSLRPVMSQYLFRSGRSSHGTVGLVALLRDQAETLSLMFGAVVLTLGLLGVSGAVRRPSTRPLALVALAVTVPYTLLLPVGAVNHDYWNFWFLLPLSLGIAVGADPLVALGCGRLVVGGALALAVVMGVASLVRPPAPDQRIREGIAAGELLAGSRLPNGQEIAWYAGFVGDTPNWINYSTGRESERVEDIHHLAATHPDDVVFVGRCEGPDLEVTYTLERAAVAAQRPPQESCTP